MSKLTWSWIWKWWENGDNTVALEVLHSWIMERGVPLSIPRVEERMADHIAVWKV